MCVIALMEFIARKDARKEGKKGGKEKNNGDRKIIENSSATGRFFI